MSKNETESPSICSSTIIKGVCDDGLLHGECENPNCDLLHLTEPIRLTDGHFHDRLLKESWACAIEPLQNIEHFIGITNVHKSSMWDDTFSIVPESLRSRVCCLRLLCNKTLVFLIYRFGYMKPMVFILVISVMILIMIYFVFVI